MRNLALGGLILVGTVWGCSSSSEDSTANTGGTTAAAGMTGNSAGAANTAGTSSSAGTANTAGTSSSAGTTNTAGSVSGGAGGATPVDPVGGGAGGSVAAAKTWWCTEISGSCMCYWGEQPSGAVSLDCDPLIQAMLEPCCIAFDNTGSFACMCDELNEPAGPVTPPTMWESCQQLADAQFTSEIAVVPPLAVDTCPSEVPPVFQ